MWALVRLNTLSPDFKRRTARPVTAPAFAPDRSPRPVSPARAEARWFDHRGSFRSARPARPAREPARSSARYLLNHFGDPIVKAYSRFTTVKRAMRATEKTIRLTPSCSDLDLYKRDAFYSISKARKLLGYNFQHRCRGKRPGLWPGYLRQRTDVRSVSRTADSED